MKQINYLLKDEKKAPGDYRKLMKKVCKTDRLKIKRIIKQEKRHFRILTQIKKKYK